jgi:N-terminal domain of anti-restriction factor ArdC
MSKSARHRRPPVSDAEREQRRAEQRELVQASIEQLRSSDGWRAYLHARRRLHSYSPRNVLLIVYQHPTATQVAGFKAWLQLGYCVTNGQRAIRIWAACPPSKRQLQAWRDAGADPDQRPRTGWRLASVFDRLSRVRSGDVADAPLGLGFQPGSRCRSCARRSMREGTGIRLARSSRSRRPEGDGAAVCWA